MQFIFRPRLNSNYIKRFASTRKPSPLYSPSRQYELSHSTLPLLPFLSYNILAPCHHRNNGTIESEIPKAYIRRHSRICSVIKCINPAVVCLQEYWFNPKFQKLYQEELGEYYNFYTVKRQKGEDGLAILVCKRRICVQDTGKFHYSEYNIDQDRVAMLMRLAPVTRPDLSFVVANTHLTYPHTPNDDTDRLHQACAAITAIDKYMRFAKLIHCPVILAGDFNGHNDHVTEYLVNRSGFYSTYKSIHNRDAAVTHCDHNGRQLGVDYIFQRGTVMSDMNTHLIPLDSCLLPHDVPDGASMSRPKPVLHYSSLGGHILFENFKDDKRPISLEDWCSLSDHRPVLTLFGWTESPPSL